VRAQERGRGLELCLRPRRVKIKPEEKRHEYIRRIDKAIETLEAIINSEQAEEKIRIQAANALARLVGTSYVKRNQDQFNKTLFRCGTHIISVK
jgi:hypothetical protein